MVESYDPVRLVIGRSNFSPILTLLDGGGTGTDGLSAVTGTMACGNSGGVVVGATTLGFLVTGAVSSVGQSLDPHTPFMSHPPVPHHAIVEVASTYQPQVRSPSDKVVLVHTAQSVTARQRVSSASFVAAIVQMSSTDWPAKFGVL